MLRRSFLSALASVLAAPLALLRRPATTRIESWVDWLPVPGMRSWRGLAGPGLKSWGTCALHDGPAPPVQLRAAMIDGPAPGGG